MSNETQIRNAIRTAQSAVEAMSDPGLRAAAFSVVLSHLLGSMSNTPMPEPAPRRGPRQHGTTTTHGDSKGKPKAARSGPQTYVSALIDDGFFETPQTVVEITEKLAERGHHIARKHVATYLQRLCQSRQLRRTKTANGEGQRAVYRYARW